VGYKLIILTLCCVCSISCRRNACQSQGVEVSPEKASGPTDFEARDRPLAAGLKLALSSSRASFEPGHTLVEVSPEAIVVDGARVASLSKGAVGADLLRDGPTGFFVTPLYDALSERVAAERAESGLARNVPLWGKIGLALHHLTSYRVLSQVLYTAEQAELTQFQFLVIDPAGARHVIRRCKGPCCRSATSYPCWGRTIEVEDIDILRGGVIGDIESMDEVMAGGTTPRPAKAQAPPVEPPRPMPLNLMVFVQEDGFRVVANGAALPAECPSSVFPLAADPTTCHDERGYPASDAQRSERARLGLGPPSCAYDFNRLGRCLERAKAEHPQERNALLSGRSAVDWQTLARVTDVVRGSEDSPLFPALFLTPPVD